ncbi:MAG: 3-dehydroquinate dehydratase, 3-dehydroquinate dehydratase I [Candidatus Peregrinibacteria bacterium GW2011_GWC2_33_13]|nr:MAG: 3-dehydroquinate dehydratase, 3-dehydroquinate dehydratase I [Candidatus Peregrinibacteria bacterium GW2011_GWC2_33_13]
MICLSIKIHSFLDALKLIRKNQNKADFFEVWLDQFKKIDYKKLRNATPKPLIAVCKGISELGNFKGKEADRVKILENAIKNNFDYIDIDIHLKKELIQKLIKNKGNSKIIISYHNFKQTPSLKVLSKIFEKAVKMNADVIKIATFANKYSDNLVIFQLIDKIKKQKKNQIIALCMGEKGKISRIIAPKLGSLLTFIPITPNKLTAPGQLTLKEYKICHKIIYCSALKK